jgi:hypothetical protein
MAHHGSARRKGQYVSKAADTDGAALDAAQLRAVEKCFDMVQHQRAQDQVELCLCERQGLGDGILEGHLRSGRPAGGKLCAVRKDQHLSIGVRSEPRVRVDDAIQRKQGSDTTRQWSLAGEGQRFGDKRPNLVAADEGPRAVRTS